MDLRRYLLVVIALGLLALVPTVSSINDLIALQGNVQESGVDLAFGNLTVTIWDAISAGNVVYNSTTDFHNNDIVDGKYDVMLGNGTNELALDYGKTYYIEIFANDEPFTFDSGLTRQIFQSSVGQVNVSEVNKSAGTSWIGQTLDTILDEINQMIADVNVSHNLWSYNQSLNVPANVAIITTANITDYYNHTITANTTMFDAYGDKWVNHTLLSEGQFILRAGDNVNGSFTFNGGWENDGVTIQNGDLWAQTIYVYNVTSLAVSHLSTNASILPTNGSAFNNTFDIGDGTRVWRNGWFGTEVYVTGVAVSPWLYNQTSAGDVRFVNIDGDNMTGNLDLGENNITSVGVIEALDGSRIRFGSVAPFTDFDNAIVVETNQTVAAGAITHALLDRQGGKVIEAWQSGKNGSWGYHRNSYGIFPDFGFTNATFLTSSREMWNYIGIDPALTYNSGANQTSLGVLYGVETQQLVLHNELGNGRLYVEGSADFILNSSTDDVGIFGGGQLWLREERTEQIDPAEGEIVNIISKDFEGGTISPFANDAAGTWNALSDVNCNAGVCAVSDSNLINNMSANVSTVGAADCNISFYVTTVNYDATDLFNVSVQDTQIYAVDDGANPSNTLVEVNLTDVVPTAVNSPSVLVNVYASSNHPSNEVAYVDDVILKCEQGAGTQVNITRYDGTIYFGESKEYYIRYNDSTKVFDFVPNNVSFSSVTQVYLNVTDTITIDGETISNWDNVSIYNEHVLLRNGSHALTDNWNVGDFNITNVNSVGIGTAAPTHELNVVGGVNISTAGTLIESDGAVPGATTGAMVKIDGGDYSYAGSTRPLLWLAGSSGYSHPALSIGNQTAEIMLATPRFAGTIPRVEFGDDLGTGGPTAKLTIYPENGTLVTTGDIGVGGVDVGTWLYNQSNLGGWNWSGNTVVLHDYADKVGIGVAADANNALNVKAAVADDDLDEKGIEVDIDMTGEFSAGTTSNVFGIDIDFDRDQEFADVNIFNDYGLRVNILDALVNAGGAATANIYGGHFTAASSGDANAENVYGIYATASGGATTNYAGYFDAGDVYVENNIVMTDEGYIGIPGNELITFDTAGDISVSGANFGIGTATPATTLDIDSNSNAQALRIRGADAPNEFADIYVASNGNLVLSTNSTGASTGYIEVDAGDNEYGFIIRDSSASTSNVWSNLYTVDSAGADYLAINVDSVVDADALVITDANTVGIGTATPPEKLSVDGGNVSINGSMVLGTNLGKTPTFVGGHDIELVVKQVTNNAGTHYGMLVSVNNTYNVDSGTTYIYGVDYQAFLYGADLTKNDQRFSVGLMGTAGAANTVAALGVVGRTLDAPTLGAPTNGAGVVGMTGGDLSTVTGSISGAWAGYFVGDVGILTSAAGNDGNLEVETGGLCVGTGGCTAPTTDGVALFEGPITAGYTTADSVHSSFGNPAGMDDGLVSSNDVYIAGKLEVDGAMYLTGGYASITQSDVAEVLHTINARRHVLCLGNSSCVVETYERELDFGDVVCIDENYGQVIKKCTEANSKLVAGAVSNTSMINMGNNLKYGYPIAVAGIVFAKVSTENGNVRPGDLLVTASRPGYAMKSDNLEQGTLLGKSYDFCEKEECIIPMFVALG